MNLSGRGKGTDSNKMTHLNIISFVREKAIDPEVGESIQSHSGRVTPFFQSMINLKNCVQNPEPQNSDQPDDPSSSLDDDDLPLARSFKIAKNQTHTDIASTSKSIQEIPDQLSPLHEPDHQSPNHSPVHQIQSYPDHPSPLQEPDHQSSQQFSPIETNIENLSTPEPVNQANLHDNQNQGNVTLIDKGKNIVEPVDIDPDEEIGETICKLKANCKYWNHLWMESRGELQ